MEGKIENGGFLGSLQKARPPSVDRLRLDSDTM